MEAAATPLPSEETTPPVTKIYLGVIRAVCGSHKKFRAAGCLTSRGVGVRHIIRGFIRPVNRLLHASKPLPLINTPQKHFCRIGVIAIVGYARIRAENDMAVAFCVTLIMCLQNPGFRARISAYGDVPAAHKGFCDSAN